MNRPPATFEARVVFARKIIEHPPPALPTWLADQMAAAAAETATRIDRLAALAPLLHPDGGWRRVQREDSNGDLTARIVAAALSATRVCVHLRRGPSPAVLRLALGRIDCTRCAGTHRNPPPEAAGRCDWCNTDGVDRFTPIVLAFGPLSVVGDACPDCARTLIGEEVRT